MNDSSTIKEQIRQSCVDPSYRIIKEMIIFNATLEIHYKVLDPLWQIINASILHHQIRQVY